MNTLRIKVNGNNAEVIDGLMPASGERKFSQLKFIFDDEWNKVAMATITMFFSRDEIINQAVSVVDNTCTVSIPDELSGKTGNLYVGVSGAYSENDVVEISTHLFPIRVGQGVVVADKANVELYKSILDAIADMVRRFALLSDFNTLKDEIVNARDGEETLLARINKIVTDYQAEDKRLFDLIYPPSKNILKLPDYSISAEDNNGIAITIKDNLISVKGTALVPDDEPDATYIVKVIPIDTFSLNNGSYTFSAKNVESNLTTGVTAYIKKGGKNISNVYSAPKSTYGTKTFEITENTDVTHFSISASIGVEINQTFNLQLEKGTKATDYVSPDERFFGGELTKDVESLKLDAITASVFGAVGDGLTDDTDALQSAIDYCADNYKVLKLESGKTYLISKVLQFTGKSIYLDGNFAKIKANKRLPSIDVVLSDNTTKTVSPMIYVDCLNINDNYNTALYDEQNYRMQIIKNLIIDCNGVVNDGIRAVRGRKVHIDDIVVINPVNNGIVINTGGWENMISNIHVSRYLESLGGTGIYIEGSDNVIDKVVVIGCQYGVINVGGDNHYSRVHPWSTTKAMENLRNSVSFGCFGSYCSFNQCMGDSTNRIFEFKYNARALITNCANTWSDSYVKNADKNPYLFYFVDDEDGKNHTLRGDGVTVSSSYFKPKSLSDYPNFKTYFSNLSESEAMFIDKVSDVKNWTNAPKSIENLIESKLDDTDGVIKTKHIAEQAITTERIAAGSVTMSKLAKDSVTGSAILNKSITDEKIADGAVTTDKIGFLAITGSNIASNTISEDRLVPALRNKINNMSGGGGTGSEITYEQVKTLIESKLDDTDGVIKTKHIAEQAITTERIAAGSVTMSKLAKDSVTGSAILNKSITDEKIADGAVTADKIGFLAITGSKIASNTISEDRLVPALRNKINNISGGGGSGGYVLTEEDKQEIADIVIEKLPNGDEVSY